jgi:hypothetical protein
MIKLLIILLTLSSVPMLGGCPPTEMQRVPASSPTSVAEAVG